MPIILSHDRILTFTRKGCITVIDAQRRPLAHFGVSTRTQTVEDELNAVEFAQTPELLQRVAQLLAELERASYQSDLVDCVRKALAACRPMDGRSARPPNSA